MKTTPNTLPCPQQHKAFTLIELLTVIAIIGILAAIIIPTVGKVRESARRTQCVSRMRELGTAMQLYAGDNKDSFVKAYNAGPGRYHLLIIPYLNPALADAFNAGRVDSNDIIRSGYFKSPPFEKVEGDPQNRGSFGHNLELEGDANGPKNPAVYTHQLTSPSTFPVLVTTGNVSTLTGGGPRLYAGSSSPYAPASDASKYGYIGATNDWGPGPVFGKNAMFLFGDWHVALKNICDKNAWPWNDSNAFKVR